MRVAFISIGDELLIGQTINTNVTWLGKEFSERGFSIIKIHTIKDDRKEIVNTLDLLLKDADVVLITGGLGPTKDDITKKVLTEYFQTHLEMHQETLERIENYFRSVGRPMLQSNIEQALLPVNAINVPNEVGTASGMIFERDGKFVISLPGVPYEMKHLMTEKVFPFLEDRFEVVSSYYQTLLTQGIGESFLADRISDLEDQLRGEGLALAYLPSPGYVRLRVTGGPSQEEKARVNYFIDQISQRIPVYAFGRNNDELSSVVGELLYCNKATVATVESCTGGKIASEIAKVPGASRYFQGAFVTYSNELKLKFAGVQEETLIKHGAVSQETVTEMALGGRNVLGVDYSIAVSGIAGPDGGSEEKPVGTVWIAVAGPEGVTSKKFQFGTDRNRTIEKTIGTALNMLRCVISKINFEKSS